MFTVEEARLLAMYPTHTLTEAIVQLNAILADVTDQAMLELIHKLLDKLQQLTPADFEEYIDAMDMPDAEAGEKDAQL